jgi:hypothetical protein
VHRRAGDLHPGGERVADGVRARERGQQRRVRVEQPPAECVEHRRSDDLHEAGRDDEVRAVLGDGGRQRAVPRRPVGEVAQCADEGRQPAEAGLLQARGVAVAADGDHRRRVVRVVGRRQQRRAERPGTREQDDHARPRGRVGGGHGLRP